jgi:hypothetical protein
MVLLNALFEYKISNGATLSFAFGDQRSGVGSRPGTTRCDGIFNASRIFFFLAVASKKQVSEDLK